MSAARPHLPTVITFYLYLFLTPEDSKVLASPVVEAGLYQGEVDGIGTLRSIEMNVTQGGAWQEDLLITMALTGLTPEGVLEVAQVPRTRWHNYSSSYISMWRVELRPGFLEKPDTCYHPEHFNVRVSRSIRSSFTTFSVPREAREHPQWSPRMRLCAVSGDWYLFLGSRCQERKPQHTANLPVLMRRVDRRPITAIDGQSRRPSIREKVASPVTVDVIPSSNEETEEPMDIHEASEGHPFLPAGQLPVGSLLLYGETDRIHAVDFAIQPVSGVLLGQLTLAASGPPAEAQRYFRYQPDSGGNVLTLPPVPFLEGDRDGCYVLSGFADSTAEAELEASLAAAGRVFGINSLSVRTIVLQRLRGSLFVLNLGTRASDSHKPDFKAHLEYAQTTTPKSRIGNDAAPAEVHRKSKRPSSGPRTVEGSKEARS
ncbi:hypothetical protein FOL46_002920 [Perkinsus olseni]|uniref:Uncharacterized protein n=1 Tax=Perkinsus olseni TaxID=32597 RepID=A0A7J6MY92_PEROL|nr:hypothetical protein FOL46_002920 [Perkinsus olseni]